MTGVCATQVRGLAGADRPLPSYRQMGDHVAMAEDWERLGHFVRSGRVALGYDPDEFAAAIKLSRKTITRIEKGLSINPDSVTKIEIGLRWMPGTAARIRQDPDAKPVPLPEEPSVDVARRHLAQEPVLTELDIFTSPMRLIVRAGELIAEERGQAEGDRWVENVLLLRRWREQKVSASQEG